MVGDRGMITSARIRALKELGGLSWITCLRASAIRKLAEDGGPLQLSLFDQQDLAEISHPDYPGERLIACRNPLLAAERARKREDLLAATEALLATVSDQASAGRLKGKDKIGVRTGKVINRYKVAKHFIPDITDDHLAWRRDQAAIDAEAALDGIYIIRSPLPADTLDAPAAVTAYKNLARVERDFRSLKPDDLDLRPIHHRLEDRVRGHVLICMLAAYLTWHLRKALAPLTYTDEQPPTGTTPSPRPRRRQGRSSYQPRRPVPAKLPRPARPPRHPHPQHRPARRPHLREDQRPHPGPAPRLRPHQDAHPARPDTEVDRTPRPPTSKLPVQRRAHLSEDTKLRPSLRGGCMGRIADNGGPD
jgi:hypothetical protein